MLRYKLPVRCFLVAFPQTTKRARKVLQQRIKSFVLEPKLVKSKSQAAAAAAVFYEFLTTLREVLVL